MKPDMIALIKQKISHIEAHPMGEFESGFVFGLRHMLSVIQAQNNQQETAAACEVISIHEARRRQHASLQQNTKHHP